MEGVGLERFRGCEGVMCWRLGVDMGFMGIDGSRWEEGCR